METQTTIHHRLDLAIRLINTVTGKVIEEKNTRFLTSIPGLKAIPRGGGLYLFLNMEKMDLDMEVLVYGFESQKISVQFSELEKGLPIREIYLIPLDNPIKDDILTLRGNLSGIEEIEAVSLMEANCCIKEFDARKRIMTVLNQRNLRFHHVHYGLVNREKTAFEHFEIEKELSIDRIKCKKVLEKPYLINQPIARIVFGQINDDGDYVLKLTKEEQIQYLVRYVVNGEEFFQKVNVEDEQVLKSHKEKEG